VSLITAAFIFERYGPRLSMQQLADVLGVAKGTLYNRVSAGTCPVTTYLDGGARFADYRAVAEHIDSCHQRANAAP
jgi:predicted DNA-binding transcriptional regulator AlpA